MAEGKVMVTTPSRPMMMLDVVEATCDSSETLAVGELMESAPAVGVDVLGVAAPVGTAVNMRAAAPHPSTDTSP
jgi:hypothetical protein